MKRLTSLCLVVLEVTAGGTRLGPKLGRERLARRKGVLHCLLAVINGPLLRLVRLLVDVLATLAGLAADLRGTHEERSTGSRQGQV